MAPIKSCSFVQIFIIVWVILNDKVCPAENKQVDGGRVLPDLMEAIMDILFLAVDDPLEEEDDEEEEVLLFAASL